MVKNATTLAIVAVHTEENEPLKIWGDLFSLFNSLLAIISPAPRRPSAEVGGRSAADSIGRVRHIHRTMTPSDAGWMQTAVRAVDKVMMPKETIEIMN